MEQARPSSLRPADSRHGWGPLTPWAAEAETYGCEWLLETSWDAEGARWALWLGCQGAFVGSCHLDPGAWGMGVCRIVDPEAHWEPDIRQELERQLDQAFFAWVRACIEKDSDAESSEEGRLPGDVDVLEHLIERRQFGLASRVLKEVRRMDQWSPLHTELAGVVAKGLGDQKGVERARLKLQKDSCSTEGLERRLLETAPPSDSEQALQNELQVFLQSALRSKTHEEILQIIAAAFDGAEMPGSEAELTTGGIDGPSVVRHFLGKHADAVESDLRPSLHMEDFTYMTARAVEYYLPCVLRLMMNTPYDHELWIYLHSFLKPRHGSQYADGVRDLRQAQLQAISEWARHLYDEWSANPPMLIDPSEALSLVAAYDGDGRIR